MHFVARNCVLYITIYILDMSFVFAERITQSDKDAADTIRVYCDTKVTPDDSKISGVSNELLRQLDSHGLVKTTIICPEFCISFAGNNIFLASKLFHRLYELNSFEREDVLREAMNIHLSATDPSDIEFIICSAEDNELHIDCIKDEKLKKDEPSAWIGSHKAFDSLQRYRHKGNGPIHERTMLGFQNAIEFCGDDSVDGFSIAAQYYNCDRSFEYVEECRFVSNKEQVVEPGEVVQFYANARDGGMSYKTIPLGIESVILDIDQTQYAILYSRGHRYDSKIDTSDRLFGLMLPMEIEADGKGGWVCRDYQNDALGKSRRRKSTVAKF